MALETHGSPRSTRWPSGDAGPATCPHHPHHCPGPGPGHGHGHVLCESTSIKGRDIIDSHFSRPKSQMMGKVAQATLRRIGGSTVVQRLCIDPASPVSRRWRQYWRRIGLLLLLRPPPPKRTVACGAVKLAKKRRAGDPPVSPPRPRPRPSLPLVLVDLMISSSDIAIWSVFGTTRAKVAKRWVVLNEDPVVAHGAGRRSVKRCRMPFK